MTPLRCPATFAALLALAAGCTDRPREERKLIPIMTESGLITYRFEDEQLTGAIASLLADQGLKPRHLAVSQQLQASPGNVRAADLIERLATTGDPVTS